MVPEQVRTQRREKSLSSSGNLIPIPRSSEPQLSPEGARAAGIELRQNDKQKPAALAYGSEALQLVAEKCFQGSVAEVTSRDQRWNEEIQRNTSILQTESGLRTLNLCYADRASRYNSIY